MKELLCVLRFASFYIRVGCGLKSSQWYMKLWIETIWNKMFFSLQRDHWIADSVWRCKFFSLKDIIIARRNHHGIDLWLDVYFFSSTSVSGAFYRCYYIWDWASGVRHVSCFRKPKVVYIAGSQCVLIFLVKKK